MKFEVRYSKNARNDFATIFEWIAHHSAPATAERFVMALYNSCEELEAFPFRGDARDDISPGLRTLGFRRRAVIAFTVVGADVTVHGIYYGRQRQDASIRDRINGDGGK